MNKYITKISLIYDFQSGFRKSHSTDTSLLYLYFISICLLYLYLFIQIL